MLYCCHGMSMRNNPTSCSVCTCRHLFYAAWQSREIYVNHFPNLSLHLKSKFIIFKLTVLFPKLGHFALRTKEKIPAQEREREETLSL